MVTSDSFKDGDYLPNDFHSVGRLRTWLCRRKQVPASEVVGGAGGNPELRSHTLRSGRAHWLGLLALARGNIPADVTELAEGAGSRGGDFADTHRLRGAGLRRTLSARGRPSAPLSVLCLRREDREARRESGQLGRGGRVQLAFQHAGQGGDHGTLQAVTWAASPGGPRRRGCAEERRGYLANRMARG